MKVILLKSVPKVGGKNEIVEVNQGYAQNALFPKKLAIPATPQAIEKLHRQKQNAQAEKDIQHALLEKAVSAVAGQTLTITVRANEQGSLFSKLHETDIAKFLDSEVRISVDPRCIVLPDGPIKHRGTYTITIVDGTYQAPLTIVVA